MDIKIIFLYIIMPKNNNRERRNNKRNRSKNQKGGRVTMPAEYFGKNSGRYFEANAPQLQMSNSAYGANRATSRGVLIGNNMSGPDLGPTRHSGVQTGGSQFDFIVNPETNRRVRVDGKIGKRVLKNYLNELYK